ncbi:MAG: prepilin-type N-terminal cleavage/methylation domain-containing protein [Candidatus Gracilibacteria bacterium]
MKYYKKGFSLIEVIIATSIITIAVFGVYRLIGENTKIINNSGNYIQVNSLFPVLEECIENIGFSSLISATGTKYNFNFGADLNVCETGTTNIVTIDNLEYSLKGIIKDTGDDFIEWELYINSDEVRTLTGTYKQIK